MKVNEVTFAVYIPRPQGGKPGASGSVLIMGFVAASPGDHFNRTYLQLHR
jgi:hypothetical protein